MYNVEEFPATPTKQAMTPRSVLNTPASPSPLAANSQPASDIAPLIDIVKLKADILAKLNTSITTMVNSSITSFIKPLHTDMNKLTNLTNTLVIWLHNKSNRCSFSSSNFKLFKLMLQWEHWFLQTLQKLKLPTNF